MLRQIAVGRHTAARGADDEGQNSGGGENRHLPAPSQAAATQSDSARVVLVFHRLAFHWIAGEGLNQISAPGRQRGLPA